MNYHRHKWTEDEVRAALDSLRKVWQFLRPIIEKEERDTVALIELDLQMETEER